MYMQDERQLQNNSSAQIETCSKNMQTDQSHMQDKWKPNQANNENNPNDARNIVIETVKIDHSYGSNMRYPTRNDATDKESVKNATSTPVACPAYSNTQNMNDEDAPTFRKSYFCVCAPKSLPSLPSQVISCSCHAPPAATCESTGNLCCSKSGPNIPSTCKTSKHSGRSNDDCFQSVVSERKLSNVVFCPTAKSEESNCSEKIDMKTSCNCAIESKAASRRSSQKDLDDSCACGAASKATSKSSNKIDENKSCDGTITSKAPSKSSSKKDFTDPLTSACACGDESKTSYNTAESSKIDDEAFCLCSGGSKSMLYCQCDENADEETEDIACSGKTSESQYEDAQGICGCTDPQDSRENAGLSHILGTDSDECQPKRTCSCANVEDKATSVYESAEDSDMPDCDFCANNLESQNTNSNVCTSVKQQETDFCICQKNGSLSPHSTVGRKNKRKSGSFSHSSGKIRNRKSLQNSTRTSSRSQSIMAEVTCLCTSTQRAKLGATNRTGPPFTRITESNCCPCVLSVVDDPCRGTKIIWKGDKFCECESGSNNSRTDISSPPKKKSSIKTLFSCCSCCVKPSESVAPTTSKPCSCTSKSLDDIPCDCPIDRNSAICSLPKQVDSLADCKCASEVEADTCLLPSGSEATKGQRSEDDKELMEFCVCPSTSQAPLADSCVSPSTTQAASNNFCSITQAAPAKPCCAKKRIIGLLDSVSNPKDPKTDRVEIVHEIIREINQMLHQSDETCGCNMTVEECMKAVESGRSPAREAKAQMEARQTESKERLDRLEKCLESCFPAKKKKTRKEYEIVAFEFDPNFKANRAAASAEADDAYTDAASGVQSLQMYKSCSCKGIEEEPTKPTPCADSEPEPVSERDFVGSCACQSVHEVESAVYADCECQVSNFESEAPATQIAEIGNQNPENCNIAGDPLTDRERQLCEYLICRMCDICQGQVNDDCNVTDAEKEAHSSQGCLCCHCRAITCDNQCQTVKKVLDPIVCNPVDEMVSTITVWFEIV